VPAQHRVREQERVSASERSVSEEHSPTCAPNQDGPITYLLDTIKINSITIIEKSTSKKVQSDTNIKIHRLKLINVPISESVLAFSRISIRSIKMI